MGPKVSIACVWTCVSRPPLYPLLYYSHCYSVPEGKYYRQVSLHLIISLSVHFLLFSQQLIKVATHHMFSLLFCHHLRTLPELIL